MTHLVVNVRLITFTKNEHNTIANTHNFKKRGNIHLT